MLQWDQALTAAVQSLHAVGGVFFDVLFMALTFLAEESFLIVGGFVTYWCLDKRMGEYLMLALFGSMAANGFLKDIIRRPRPFLTEGYNVRYLEVDNFLVNTVKLADSFSFPSGHSQCAAGLWTALALWFKKRWFWAVAALLTLGVMASRVYLGVHFPSDVVAGAALGVLGSVLTYWLFNRFYEQRLWLFAVVILLLLPALFVAPSPDTAKTLGVGVGALAGMAWEHRRIRFESCRGKPGRIAARLILGAALVLGLRVGLRAALPHTLFFDGLRYAVMGFAATGLVPWLFVRMKI